MEPIQTPNAAPALKLPTNRGLLKFILLGIITFGIYPLVVMCKISSQINTVASRYDGRSTMHFILVALLTGITFGIVPLVWYHKLSRRIGNELLRRNIPYSFGAGTYWGWNILGSFIFVGPFIYTHKLLKATNLINADYNAKG